MQRTHRLLRASQSSAARVLTAQRGQELGLKIRGRGAGPGVGFCLICAPPPGTQLITVHSLDAGELTMEQKAASTQVLSAETLTVVGSEAGRCSTLGRTAGCVFFF